LIRLAWIGLVVALLAGCTEGPPHQPAPPPPSLAQVLAGVGEAAAIRKVPADLLSAGSDVGYDSDKCEAGPSADRIDACVFGDRASAVNVVLYGDSHAGMWVPALDAVAASRHWRLYFYGKPGCPTVALPRCDRFRAYVLDQIRALRPQLVVVTNFSQKPLMSPARWRRSLASTLLTLRRYASRVVVLGDTPVLRESAPECLARHALDVPACFTGRFAATSRVWNDADSAAARAAAAGYIPVLPWLCGEVCTPVIGEVTVYRNRFHLTATYVRVLRGVLAEALDRAIEVGSGGARDASSSGAASLSQRMAALRLLSVGSLPSPLRRLALRSLRRTTAPAAWHFSPACGP
jgi:hypothetical protein